MNSLGFFIVLYFLEMTSMTFVQGSAVTSRLLRGRRFFFKRDDLMTSSSGLSGNKARKFMHLEQSKLPPSIVSFGGHQSNALRALALLVNRNRETEMDSHFTYYCKAVPSWLKADPVGAYADALALGALFVELDNEEYDSLSQVKSAQEAINFLNLSASSTLFIPQGGACDLARPGSIKLADEIVKNVARLTTEQDIESNSPWKVLIASGTGATAVYVHERLRSSGKDIEVVAIPCVGSQAYLEQQMANLADANDRMSLPIVLNPLCKHAFGKPRKELLDIWAEIRDLQAGLDFDLVYAPRAFEIIMDNLNSHVLEKSNLLYYHCGGLEGNESQMRRYERSGLHAELRTALES